MTERESMLLTTPAGVAPRTEGGQWGIVMLKSSGRGEDSQWFDLRPAFYQPIIRVEWELDTMSVAIPQSIAELLIHKGYARVMTLEEAQQYNQVQVPDSLGEEPEEIPHQNGSAPQEPTEEPASPPAAPPPQSSVSPPPQRPRRRLSDEKGT